MGVDDVGDEDGDVDNGGIEVDDGEVRDKKLHQGCGAGDEHGS